MTKHETFILFKSCYLCGIVSFYLIKFLSFYSTAIFVQSWRAFGHFSNVGWSSILAKMRSASSYESCCTFDLLWFGSAGKVSILVASMTLKFSFVTDVKNNGSSYYGGLCFILDFFKEYHGSMMSNNSTSLG